MHRKAAHILSQLYKEPLNYRLRADYSALSRRDAPFDRKEIADRYHEHLTAAKIELKEHNLLEQIRTLDSETGAPFLPIAIYLDNLRSAHNVGSIVRTTEAFRLGTLYFSLKTGAPNNKKIQDASMGADEWVSCKPFTSFDELPRPVIALETATENASRAVSLSTFLFPPSFTLILGNEEYGCSDSSLAAADWILDIPLCGRKNSLNVANAYAIVAAQIRMQYPA